MLRILLLEEKQSEIRLIESILSDSQLEFESRQAKNENEFIRMVNNYQPDSIISGSTFSKYSVNEALQYLNEHSIYIPFILISSDISDESSREYIKKGVDDCLNKFNILSLPVIITRAINNKKLLRQTTLESERVKNKEQRFKQFYENNNDLIIEFGVKTEILSINPATEKSIGLPFMLNKKVRLQELVFHEDLKKFRELHSSAFRGHKKDIVVRLQWKKNQVTVNGRLLPIYNDENEISSVMLIGSDVTEQISKEKDLQLIKSSYEALFESIHDAVCIFDSELKLCSYNSYMADQIRRAFRVKLKKGMDIEEIFPHPLLFGKWKDRLNEVLKGNPVTVEDSIEIDGEITYAYVSCYPFKMTESKSHVLLISKNISEYKRTEEELKKNEQWFRTLSENAPVGIFKTDRKGNCEYVNRYWCEMAGITPDQAQEEGWTNVLHPEDRERVISVWKETMINGSEFKHSFRLINGKTNKTTWVKSNAISIRKPLTGIIDGYIGTVTDVSHLFALKKEEEEKKILLKTIEETAQIGFWIVNIMEREKDFWSDGLYSIFEFDKTKGIPEFAEYMNLIHPEDKPLLKEKLKNLFNSGESFKQEFRMIFSDGRVKTILGMGNAVKGKDGLVERIIGTIKDISEIYRKQEVEVENAFLLQQAFTLANIGTWEYDVINKKGSWSRELKILFGIDEHQDSDPYESFLSCIVPEDRQLILDFQANQIQCGKAGSIQFRIRVHGEIRTMVSISHVLTNSQGNIIKLMGITMDISFKVREQQERKQSEQLMRDIFDSSPDAIFIEDEAGNILNANAKASEIQGLGVDQIIGRNILDFTPKENHQQVMETQQRIFSGEVEFFEGVSVSQRGLHIPVQIRVRRINYLGKPAVLLSVREILEIREK
jgi:PAS domain S-box-containing protein